MKIVNYESLNNKENLKCSIQNNILCQKQRKIIENIRALHSNVSINQKSNILSIVAYNSLKKILRKNEFKFTDSQFRTALYKRKCRSFNLDKYTRFIPYSKRKIDESTLKKITAYLEENSRVSSREEGVRYLERSKKDIYRKYINDGNEYMTYGTFLKKCHKKYKKGKKRTDVCGICELSKKVLKRNLATLNNEEKSEYKRTQEIYEMHCRVVDNQKNQFNYLKQNMIESACVLILDYKENFKLSHGGDEIGQDFYTKRQISCLGVCLIFKHKGNIIRHYLNFLSEILTHDSLFSSDCLKKVIDGLKNRFQYFNVFTDCGPHFRSREFLSNAKILSKNLGINISVNSFGEHHGKSEVDGMFGKLGIAFKKIDYSNEIHNVHELKTAFENEFRCRNWENVFFSVYEREKRPKWVRKIIFKGLKNVMSFLFIKGKSLFSFLTKINEEYTEFDPKEQTEEDKRVTSYTPKTCFESRIKNFFNERIHRTLSIRVG